jgi:F-type H+-transporting ATPase subunit alpha
MKSQASDIASILEKDIEALHTPIDLEHTGVLTRMSDAICQIYGLEKAVLGEKILIGDAEIPAIVMNLEYEQVGVVVLGDPGVLKEGDIARSTGLLLDVPVGEALLGRVVTPLGVPLDGLGALKTTEKLPLEREAPGVIDRESVSESLATGIKSIDTMVPIGRGQRELIIGDRQVGKTALAIDAILNQAGTGVKCIYVAIGQKNSTVAYIHQKLKDHGALSYTVIVNASASDSAALQYLAPYAGSSIGEYFRDKGEDALIVFDDLTKHAWAYRQISLLLRRPPGREAYPGDVFYLHSRLLERSSRVSAAYVERMTSGLIKGKTGSLTALPIIETQAGDVSAFVPTNVISITDGQVFLETDLFFAGIRPAVNAGLSVSRVGGAAQSPIVKKLGAKVRLALAQYRELAAFSQFASDLDETTKKQLDRGKRVVELLKQKQYKPQSVAQIALTLYAVEKGYFDIPEIENLQEIEERLCDFCVLNYTSFMQKLVDNPVLSAENEEIMKELLNHAHRQGVFA